MVGLRERMVTTVSVRLLPLHLIEAGSNALPIRGSGNDLRPLVAVLLWPEECQKPGGVQDVTVGAKGGCSPDLIRLLGARGGARSLVPGSSRPSRVKHDCFVGHEPGRLGAT